MELRRDRGDPGLQTFRDCAVPARGGSKPPSAGSSDRGLESIIKELHDCEINAGVQTYYPDGLRVWLGDQFNGLVASARVRPEDTGWSSDGTAAHGCMKPL
jgi:hypothetical protein